MSSKLLITIPSYRQPEALRRALQALSEQTFKDFEVLILDDHSGVNMESIISPFSSALTLHVLTNKHNLGAMENMFKSITHPTECDYLFSHHEDDFIKSNYLELAIKILDKNDQISFVATTPEWIHAAEPYKKKSIHDGGFVTFTDAEFVYNVLNRSPLMFGSVIYRTSHLIADWRYDLYATFCDRYLLGQILSSHGSTGALIPEPGIYVHDHSQDQHDTRANKTSEDNAISLFAFYKTQLQKEYHEPVVRRLLTNNLLFMHSNFGSKSSLWTFYQKQQKYDLIHFSHLLALGVYSILTHPLPPRLKKRLFSLSKKIVYSLRAQTKL